MPATSPSSAASASAAATSSAPAAYACGWNTQYSIRKPFQVPGMSTHQPVDPFGTRTVHPLATKEKAEFPTVGAVPLNTMPLSQLQGKNAESPMLVTRQPPSVEGIVKSPVVDLATHELFNEASPLLMVNDHFMPSTVSVSATSGSAAANTVAPTRRFAMSLQFMFPPSRLSSDRPFPIRQLISRLHPQEITPQDGNIIPQSRPDWATKLAKCSAALSITL